jgi:hypothetical protein
VGAQEARVTLTAGGRLATRVARVSKYRPWWAQRMFHRSPAPIRVVVAGRQSGKTHSASEECARIMLARPGTTSCLLMPTYKSTKGPLKHLRRALTDLLGAPGPAGRWRWKEVDKKFELFNGAELYVRTADDKEGVPTRGLTVDGVLWIDEAAYVPQGAVDAARFTQAAVADPRVIITTSPAGKNWVFEEFAAGLPGPKRSSMNESFRFRSVDSPYCTQKFVDDLKQKVGARKAMQELNAEFLGDANAAFDPDDLAKLFVGSLAVRGQQLTIGLDLGKEQDFTVPTLMNEFGEAWVLGRWRRVKWDVQEARIIALAREHEALVVIDEGHGGGYGGTMADYLERALGQERVLRVKTGNLGVKAQIVETLAGDVENGRLRALADELGQVLRHEMTFFEAHRTIVGGVERWRYHAPEGGGGEEKDDDEEDGRDHDDCVISLALANWGRVHGWEKNTGDGGLGALRPRGSRGSGGGGASPRIGGGSVGRRGYMLR